MINGIMYLVYVYVTSRYPFNKMEMDKKERSKDFSCKCIMMCFLL